MRKVNESAQVINNITIEFYKETIKDNTRLLQNTLTQLACVDIIEEGSMEAYLIKVGKGASVTKGIQEQKVTLQCTVTRCTNTIAEYQKKLDEILETENLRIEAERLEAANKQKDAQKQENDSLIKAANIAEGALQGAQDSVKEMAIFWPTSIKDAGIQLVEGAAFGAYQQTQTPPEKEITAAPTITLQYCSDKEATERLIDTIVDGVTVGAGVGAAFGIPGGIPGVLAGSGVGAIRGGVMAGLAGTMSELQVQEQCKVHNFHIQ